jgi:type IV pilus assembly protein PilC
MKFKYQAKTKGGEMQIGFVEAGNRDAAANILASHELFVLSLEQAEKRGFIEAISSYFGRVSRKDMIVFTRQLATLLEARLPLNTALKTLYEQTKQPVLREAIFQMAEDIDAGLSFSQAMARQGTVFPEFYVEMVRAAEITGNLNEIASFLADYAEKEGALVSKAASALIYPAIVVSLFVAVGFIMVTFVFPQIQPVFERSGVQLPIYTRILLSSGTFLGKWWPAIIVALIFMVILVLDYARTNEGRALIDDSKIKLPILNKIYLPIVISRFSNAAALLIHGGIPIAQAFEVIGHMVGNVLYGDIIHEIAEDIRQGTLLSQSIEKYPEYFPALVPQMISVGEKTGKMEQIFGRLASYYSRESDNVMNSIVDLIQPVLMILIGVMVGLLFASILIPLYRLTATFG